MDKYIKNIIEETFKSKKQQRLFFAKANDKSLSKKERLKWKNMSKEFSDDTDYKNLPDEVEKEVDEIVNSKGNFGMSKVPNTKESGSASKKTTDQVVKTGYGTMGSTAARGAVTSLRYWAESDMSKTLGYKKTLGQDVDKDDAEDYFKDELGIKEPEADERLDQMGYDDNLKGDKVRLIENPKKYVQDYVESVLSKKSKSSDLVNKEVDEDVEKDIEPIIKKQILALKNTLTKNNVSVKDVIKILNKKDNE
jgi:hypothetical protein